MTSPMRLAAERIRRWRLDPIAFVREEMGAEPDAWQADALRAWADPAIKRISLQACVGPGKSALLAWCGWHFLGTQGDRNEHPKGFAVAVTADNLRANLWPELAKWRLRSRTGYISTAFEWSAERCFARDHKATWFLEARSWPKTASPDEQGKTLSGLHGAFVCALVDESGAIPPAVARAADQALSTEVRFGKILQAGNPLSHDGMLYDASKSPLWHVIRITGDPDDPRRSPRIGLEWARQQIQEHGRDNAWVQAHILGQFPKTAINQLLGPDEVREAMARGTTRVDQYQHAGRVLGVDVSREGDDRSVIFPRQGIASFMPDILRGADSITGAGAVARKWEEWQADACFIDNTGGFGGGWLDQLRLLRRAPIGIHFSGTPNDPRYANKRAEMWFEMAKWVKEGGALPNLPEIVGELTTPTYFFKGDKVQIEDKDQVKTRLGRSPDLADALALTFAHPVYRRSPLDEMRVRMGNRERRDHHPFDRLKR